MLLTQLTFSGSPFKSYLSVASDSGNMSQHIYSEPHQHQVKELQQQQQHYSVRRVTGSREEYKADIKGKQEWL